VQNNEKLRQRKWGKVTTARKKKGSRGKEERGKIKLEKIKGIGGKKIISGRKKSTKVQRNKEK